jgi:hypothetical protein
VSFLRGDLATGAGINAVAAALRMRPREVLINLANFWKQFYRKFPQYRQPSVTARDFSPGD